MNIFLEWLSRLFGSWKFWVVVPPWDVGIRVRLGKVAAKLEPGPHLRIPFIDEITLVNTRLRIDSTNAITIAGTRPGTARVVGATVGFRIIDPVAAAKAYTIPGNVVSGLVQREVALGHSVEEAKANVQREIEGAGLTIDFIYLYENVEVRTYRLMQGGGGTYAGGEGSGIQATPTLARY